jgi:hypothetical protein
MIIQINILLSIELDKTVNCFGDISDNDAYAE